MTPSSPLVAHFQSRMSTPEIDSQGSIDPVRTQSFDKQADHDDWDEYSDFAEDPESLEIINSLVEAAIQQQHTPLKVTDIEDYEAPRGVYLPKVPGLELMCERDSHGERLVGTQMQQVTIDQSGRLTSRLRALSC
jgi:hypothetical protein